MNGTESLNRSSFSGAVVDIDTLEKFGNDEFDAYGLAQFY